MGDCQFFSFPTAGESARLGITMDSDPNLVLGCEAPQGDGPLFFFVPVPGGAVRVPVCAKHGERLTFLYGGQGGTGEQAQIPGVIRPHLLEMLRDGTTASAVAAEFGVQKWKALAWLAVLRNEGLACLDGTKRGAHWRLTTPPGGAT